MHALVLPGWGEVGQGAPKQNPTTQISVWYVPVTLGSSRLRLPVNISFPQALADLTPIIID